MAEKNIFASIVDFFSRQAEYVGSTEVRNEAYQKSTTFARDRPFTFSFIVLGLALVFSPILTAVTVGLFVTVCLWSLLACLTIIILTPALVPSVVIAAIIWLSYTTIRSSANLFAKTPVGSGNESNRVLMKPEAEANGNQAHAKLELNLFKIEDKEIEKEDERGA